MGGAFSCLNGRMKQWLSWSDQLALLQERGLVVGDRAACEVRLRSVNYYRFSGYARYFQIAPHEGDSRFHAGTTFGDVWALVEADADLSAALMPRLGQVEIALRTRYAYVVGRDVGLGGNYLNDAFFSGGPRRNRCQRLAARTSTGAARGPSSDTEVVQVQTATRLFRSGRRSNHSPSGPCRRASSGQIMADFTP